MSRSPRASHQHHWHSTSKRQNMSAWRDEKSDGVIDGSNADHVKLLLEDLQTKYDQMINLLKADLVDTKMQQEEALSTGLMRLPKSIRQMTVREFNQAHSCDILALLKGKDGVKPKAMKQRDYNMAVAETPAPRTRNPNAPNSMLRTARRGEGLYSSNGSPLESHEAGSVVATVTKKSRGNDSATFEINVGDGRFISLNDPSGVQELDSSMKATAASQLKVLQDQMASLMAQLTK